MFWKIVQSIGVAGIFLAGFFQINNYAESEEILTNKDGVVDYYTYSFDEMELSAPAVMTVRSRDPFSLKTDKVIDSNWDGGDVFSVGPLLIDTGVEFRYGGGQGGQMHFTFNRQDERPLTVVVSGGATGRYLLYFPWILLGVVGGITLLHGIWRNPAKRKKTKKS